MDSQPNRKLEALFWALLCHGTFLLAITIMAWQLYCGLQNGIVELSGASLWFWNLFLLFQFPLLHSLLLSKSGRSWMEKILGENRKVLAPSLYVTIASLQLMLTFVLWAPTHLVVLKLTGFPLFLSQAAYALGWILLALSMWEAGLSSQMGYAGWCAMWSGRKFQYKPFAKEGLHGKCRHPIYFSFLLILLSGPVWTADHLLIACTWGVYCLIGPKLKELRYQKYYGKEFEAYRMRVPYFPYRLSPNKFFIP